MIQQNFVKANYNVIYGNQITKDIFDESIYDYVYPTNSLPSRLYGTPKIYKIMEKSDIPPLGPSVTSINSYNYNLAKSFM